MNTPQHGKQDSETWRLLLAVALSGAVLLGWNLIFPTAPVERPAPTADGAGEGGKAGEAPADKAGEPADGSPAAAPTPAAPAAKPIERKIIGQLEEPDHHTVEFTNDDGQIATWALTEAQYLDTLDDGSTRPFRFVGPVEPVIAAAKQAAASDTEDEEGKKGIFEPPALELTLAGQPARGEYTLARAGERETALTWTDPATGVVVTRTYRLDPSGYTVSADLTLKNPGNTPVAYDLSAVFRGVQNDEEATGSMFMPPVYLFESICEFGEEFERLDASSIKSAKEDGDPVAFDTAVKWGGVDNRYFMTALLAESGTIERCTAATDREGLPTTFSRLIQTLDLTGGEIAAGGEVTRTLTFYAGPKKLSELQNTTPPMGEAIDFGFFAAICVPMLWLMRFFFEFVGNWGVAIILLTVFVKLLTLPLTLKQYKSMAAMKVVQPEMKKLQEKYKDDKAKLQQEMMTLYREHKINPLAGCLPMVLMMPIYFSLYRTIYSAVELYRADFALWLTDLSVQDPFYVTPLLLGVLMFGQMKLNPSAGEAAQQKIIMYVMPVMFAGMMLFLPSGLVIYILVNTVLGIVQQLYMLKQQQEQAPAGKDAKKSPKKGKARA